MKNKKLITTSIAYVNGEPHIGFAMEVLEADAYKRYLKNRGYDVYFITGTDEHGSKINKTAKEKGVSTQELCDINANKFKDLCEILHISNDDFIRTTEERHKLGAKKIWEKISKSGDFKKQDFEGKYCVGCESFITEKDLNEKGECVNHLKKPEIIKEKNIFFLMSKYTEVIKNSIKSKKIRIEPEFRQNEILNLLDVGLQDISFSRPKEVLNWGINVPNDDSQVMYVWCDALTNYLSAVGYGSNEKWKEYWSEGEVIHFIGKDILRFHAGIWPAMLSSAKIKLPEKIFVHGFLTSEGHKMSKSLGNVVDPFKVVEDFNGNPDPLRFFLLSEVPFGKDADFSQERFLSVYNDKLCNGVGNLLSRVVMLSKKFSTKSETKKCLDYIDKIKTIKCQIDNHMSKCELHLAIGKIFDLINFANLEIDREKPWIKIKTNKEGTESLIAGLIDILKFISKELECFIPHSSKKMQKSIQDLEPIILFPRI